MPQIEILLANPLNMHLAMQLTGIVKQGCHSNILQDV